MGIEKDIDVPVFPATLLNVGWRYLVRHPLQTILMVVGITLGVAVVVAIDLANASASRAFDISVDTVAGKATHQIVGGPTGIDEDLFATVKSAYVVDAVAPIISEYVNSPDIDNGRPLSLLGVDPFSEGPFRNYLSADGDFVPVPQLVSFLTDPGAILISMQLAEDNDLEIGDSVTLEFSGASYEATVAGLLSPQDSLSQRSINGIILADIATVQEMTGNYGRIERIDLIVPEENRETYIEELEALLPEDARLQAVDARTGTVDQMVQAFRTNLLALSLLALIVGMFLIYNTMTFSVVQRRVMFGTLRSLGVTRREVFLMVVGEAMIIGVIGAVLGIGLGVLMGQGAVQLVTRTINDLFFVVSVRGVQVPPRSIIVGAVLGICATALSAAVPAYEAASVPPRAAMTRSTLETKSSGAVKWTLVGGLGLNLLGVAMLLIPSRSLALSFTATFFVIIGFALFSPLVLVGIMRGLRPLTTRAFGVLGRMAPREISGALSRTSIAVAALMVAVSVTIGISLMVGSFRRTVILWLEQSLQGDVYISVADASPTTPSASLDDKVIETLQGWEGVERVSAVRNVFVDSPLGQVNVSAISDDQGGSNRLYLSTSVPEDDVFEATRNGAVVVSEPFARRFDLWDGDQVTLYTDTNGAVTFPIVAVYYDYGSSAGRVGMALDQYRSLWNDDSLTVASLRLDEGVSPDEVSDALEAELEGVQDLLIRPNKALRDAVLVVFDQTFAITGALNILATIVAFIGVLSALLSLQLEKQRELGILRSIGLTVRQLWGLVMLETGLMGFVAGLLALPTGFVLSLILIYIINRRSFGWTLQMSIIPGPFIQAMAVAIIAALLAGIYPARRVSRMGVSDAVRFE